MDLSGGFIGDKVPLCIDLPEKHFLKKGATYRLLGSSPQPDLHEYAWIWYDIHDWFEGPQEGILSLNSGSNLKSALSSNEMLVTLESDIPCSGNECSVDTLIVVQTQDDPPIFYEYVRQPCVELSFYENAKKIARWETSMCANPKIEAAYDMCCPEPNGDKTGRLLCEYMMERTSQSTARSRCQSRFESGDLCHFGHYWREDSCTTQDFQFWHVSLFTMIAIEVSSM